MVSDTSHVRWPGVAVMACVWFTYLREGICDRCRALGRVLGAIVGDKQEPSTGCNNMFTMSHQAREDAVRDQGTHIVSISLSQVTLLLDVFTAPCGIRMSSMEVSLGTLCKG